MAEMASSSPTWRVYVGKVPSSLCLHEPGVREIFEPFGAIASVTIHHDALSIGADGFMFLEFVEESAARAAAAAVAEAADKDDPKFEGMVARMAMQRGPPSFQADVVIVDLLRGHRQASSANPFSQHNMFSQHDEQDEDELMLQSLSQRASRRSSQGTGKHKKKKRRTIE